MFESLQPKTAVSEIRLRETAKIIIFSTLVCYKKIW